MNFDEILVKECPGLCRCCLSEGCFKDLSSVHTVDDQKISYEEMLLTCFNINISHQTQTMPSSSRPICEVCVTQLRSCWSFRLQVEESERRFLQISRDGFCVNVSSCKQPKDEPIIEQIANDNESLDNEDKSMDVCEDTNEDNLDSSSEDITLANLPPKRRRGRPRKDDTTHRPKVKDITTKQLSEHPTNKRRKDLETLFNNTSIIPFKWRGKYMCFYCGKEIYEHSDLRKHTLKHGKCSVTDYALQSVRSFDMEVKIDVSVLTCELCSENFTSYAEIVMHLNTKHDVTDYVKTDASIKEYRLSDLTCQICGEYFTSFRQLVSHTSKYHPDNVLVCDKCSQKFSKRRDLETHVRNYHKGVYECKECELVFESKSKLRSHKEGSHKQACGICFHKFASTQDRMRHIEEKHLKDGLKCRFCSKEWATKHAFLQHTNKCKKRDEFVVKDHSDVFEGTDDKKPVVRVMRQNLAHIFNMTTALPFKFFMSRFRCFYCPSNFVDSDELKTHTVNNHPVCDVKHRSMKLRAKDDVDIKVDVHNLTCKVCHENVPNLEQLIEHLITEHKINYDRQVKCKIVTYHLIKDSYKCPICVDSENYKFFGNLLKHMNKVHTNNHLICVYCGKTFRTDHNLRSHISRYHAEAKQKCTECELVFNTGVKLNTHLARVHGKKVVKCPKCPEKFLNSYLRQKHLITVHNSGASCPHCGRMFTGNALMQEHIRRTHLKEKNVECPICSTMFFDNFMLRMHMVRHAGDRNFHCDVCGKKFLWKKNLRNHMTTHEKRQCGLE